MNKNDLLKAVELALAQKWDEAHHLVQKYEDETASWIHAVLHKIEGDMDNSRYWYRRAEKMQHEKDRAEQELKTIQVLLISSEN